MIMMRSMKRAKMKKKSKMKVKMVRTRAIIRSSSLVTVIVSELLRRSKRVGIKLIKSSKKKMKMTKTLED